jgi:hypothetical protein
MSGVQLRLLAGGYALPIRPEVLALESELERAFIYASLRLDEEQEAAAEAAVAAVLAREYPKAVG